MLYTDFTEKLLGLQNLKVTKIEKTKKQYVFMPSCQEKRIIGAVAMRFHVLRQPKK